MLPSRSMFAKALLSVSLCMAGARLHGQTDAELVARTPTIHVHRDLMQVPVLVLDSKLQPLPPVPPSQFSVRFDTAKPFAPMSVRREGDDPLTLNILLDDSRKDPVLEHLPERLAAMVPEELHPSDRVALYAVDGCKLRRFQTLSAANASVLQNRAEAALAYKPYDSRARGAEPCPSPMGLWDAMAWIAQSMSTEQGQRVMLVVSNGQDTVSKVSPYRVHEVAISAAVAVFSMTERYVRIRHSVSELALRQMGAASDLAYVSELTGGMVLETKPADVPATLARFAALLRGRYILEFERPDMAAGRHVLQVSTGRNYNFIRPAGTSVPVGMSANTPLGEPLVSAPLFSPSAGLGTAPQPSPAGSAAEQAGPKATSPIATH